MKSLKYLLISSFALIANVSFACWGDWFVPSCYYMYRVFDAPEVSEFSVYGYSSDVIKNCEQWQKLTSLDISLEDIHQVVYKMPLEEFEKIYDNRQLCYDNKFAEWITKKDSAILDFLLLAKTNEHIRLKRNSKWYYPSMKIKARMTIDEVVEKALSTVGSPLRDRYLLQGVRALFSLGRYAECVELWEKEGIRLPEDNLMRQMLLPYIAGAEFHTNHTEKALCYFAELGDVQSMLYCAGRKDEDLSVVDALEMVCDYAPNSSYIEKTLQTYIRKLEPMGEYYWEDNFEVTPELQKLYSLCLKMTRSGRSNNPALWYYTASFLLDLNSEYSKASELLTLAEKSKSTDFIDESIKVFRIYLDAKVRVYDASYDSRLLAQLRWLDSKICNNIDDKVRDYTAYGYKLCRNESYYYWNDMMRRILLAELCPRMIKAGRPIRALQLANMADNRLLALVDRADSQTMAEYRNSENHNFYDYNRSFFEMIDSLGVNTAIAYLQNVRNPKNEFDRFLNERGYVADDYLNDIVGTQLLRNMRYAEAVKYLGAVGVACRNQLNVYMFYDPFCINPTPIKTNSDFRYDFAVEMYSIEQRLKMTTDPDRRAKLMYRYAIGLRNSFDRCWGITHYYKGESYWAQVDKKRDWSKADYTKTALKRADELIAAACDIVTDDELAAEIHYELCHFKTVAEMYPNTPQGILVRGNCDNIRDYKVNYR